MLVNAATPTADAGGVPRGGLAIVMWLGPHEIAGLWEQGHGCLTKALIHGG